MVKSAEISNVKIEDGSAFVDVNPELFSVEAVLNAAYILTDKAYVVIDGDIDRRLCVEIKPKSEDGAKTLAMDFCNELVRAQVYLFESENKSSITKAIVEEAMAGLTEEEDERE